MVRISWSEYQKIKDIKILDLEICDYQHVNILNLGWESWGKWFCRKHEKEHVLCPRLCLPVSRNVLGCELVRKRVKRTEDPPKPNRPYDWANCYGCSKELRGAGKTGKIKSRNNPSFWGIKSAWKILCLKCLGRKYYQSMSKGKQRTFNKYVKRGYV